MPGGTALLPAKFPRPTVPAGAAVMSGGIFSIAAAGELPFPDLSVSAFVCALLLLWGYLAVSFAARAFRGSLRGELSQPVAAFAVGTWVAGSAVLGRAVLENIPAWQPLAVGLWIVAVVVTVFYATLLPAAFRSAMRSGPDGFSATGVVLLPVVAVQSLVVSGGAALPGGLPGPVAVGLVCAGGLLYVFGGVLILRRYVAPGWSLSSDWDDSNCILHGALSISGLAALQTGAFPNVTTISVWLAAFAVFVVVEGIELTRAVVRIRRLGASEGILTYHTPQWSRVFTFGMLYALSFQLSTSGVGFGFANAVGNAVVEYGQYIVLALLVAEVFLFIYRHRLL